jgi:predicted RNase H-like HicB family nuclease
MTASRKIEVLWSEKDQVWIADVPGLPFCTAHGPTPHEAVARVEQAAKAWLATAAARGNGELISSAHSQ